MAYSLKYQCDFDSASTAYTIEIYEDGYSGPVIPLTGAATPITQAWETDEPKPPIKGSSIVMNFINEGNIPLLDLYSINDEQFKARLIWHSGTADTVLFEGFIVTEDCNELMVDYNHEISLSANDNLGLLKEVSFAEALGTVSPYDLISLATIIKLCIVQTGLSLQTQVFANINETTQSPSDCFLDQTFLDPQTFNSGSAWDDCYTVLTKLFDRFNCTLFQAKGRWNVIRWPELMDYDYSIPGFLYDEDFVYLDTVELNEAAPGFSGWPKFEIGIDELTQAETGLMQRITRPLNHTKETFNYRLPAELLRNANLQELGTLLSTYTTGAGETLKTIREYGFPWWTTIPGSYTGGTPEYFIRVIEDSLSNEIDRAAVLKNGALSSHPIQAAAGDRFHYSFSAITTNSTPGNFNVIFEIKIDDGTTTKYLQEVTLAWLNTVGYTVTIPAGENGNTVHTFDIAGTIPYDGLLTVSLEDFPGAGETQYRDIRLEYTPMINQSTKIIGHFHKDEQQLTIKNTDEKEIFVDSSPRNSLAGTLFLSTLTGVLRNRAVKWERDTRTEALNLGEITTEENLFLRRIPRTLLEGNFYGLITPEETAAGPVQVVDHVSMLSVCKYTFFPLHNFIFGRLEIDYRNNMAAGTLHEMYKDNEAASDLTDFYIIHFLYATK